MSTPFPDPITKPFSNTGDNAAPPLGPIATAANQETGFPILESTPLNAGGIPVTREEFNGAFNFYTKQILALVSGARFTFDAALSTAQNGYPINAVLYCASNNSLQRSLVDNNTANFITTPSYINDGINWSAVVIDSIFCENLVVKNGGTLFIYDQNSLNAVTFMAPPLLVADTNYTLPTAYPTTSGEVLSSDTSGVTSWKSLNFLNINRIIYTQNSSTSKTNGENLTFATLYDNTAGLTPSSLYNTTTGVFTAPITTTYYFEMEMYFENSATDFSVLIQGSLLPAAILWFSQEAGVSRIFGNPSRHLKLTAGETVYFEFTSVGGILSYGGLFNDIPQFSVSWYAP